MLQGANDVIVGHIALAIIVLVNGDDARMSGNLRVKFLEVTAVVRQDDPAVGNGVSQMLSVRQSGSLCFG